MEDIREQMVQAIEQMKSNLPQPQQTLVFNSLVFNSLVRKLAVTIQPIEQMESCIFQKIVSLIDKSGNDFPHPKIWAKIESWGRHCPDSDGIDIKYIKNYIINYCSLLEFLEQQGIICIEKVFGAPAEDITAKLDDCYVRGKLQRKANITYQSENAYLNAIKERSKEAAQILRDIYPEELTCASVIVKEYIGNPQFVQCYLELFPEELLATLKSEKLLYCIFWKWDCDDILHFIKSALDYDKDYFKDYKDELGNNCLYYYLARFELGSRWEYEHSEEGKIIKSLLLENGVNPDEENIGGISYHDLSSYIEKYWNYYNYCKFFWEWYEGEEYFFPEYNGGYASKAEMDKDSVKLGWYKWTYKYLIYTPRSLWNCVVVYGWAKVFGIKVSDITDMKEFKELQAKRDEAQHIRNQLQQMQCEDNMRYQREDMQYQIEDQIEDQIEEMLYQKDVRAFKLKHPF